MELSFIAQPLAIEEIHNFLNLRLCYYYYIVMSFDEIINLYNVIYRDII